MTLLLQYALNESIHLSKKEGAKILKVKLCLKNVKLLCYQLMKKQILLTMTTREQAMKWWNNLSLEYQFYEVIPWLTSSSIWQVCHEI